MTNQPLLCNILLTFTATAPKGSLSNSTNRNHRSVENKSSPCACWRGLAQSAPCYPLGEGTNTSGSEGGSVSPHFHITFLGTLRGAACFLKVTMLILILPVVCRLPVYGNAAFCSPPVSGLSSINISKQSHKAQSAPC